MTGDTTIDQTSERVEAVLILMRDFEPWERAQVRVRLREAAPLRLYVPPEPIAWTPALEAEAVAQGLSGPTVVEAEAAAVRAHLADADDDEDDDTDVWPAGVVLAGQDDAE